MCYSNSILSEALKLDSAHTDKETNNKNLSEFPDHVYFQMTMIKRTEIYCSNKISKLQVRVITKGISNYISTGHIQYL